MTGTGAGLRRFLIGLPFVWLAVFFLLPLAIVAAISVAESADAQANAIGRARRSRGRDMGSLLLKAAQAACWVAS